MKTIRCTFAAGLFLAAFAAVAGEMTMMSFNVRIGCGMHDPFKLPEGGLGHLPQCAEVIRSADPDWVAIQEIDRCSQRVGLVDQTAALAKMCGMHGTFVKKIPKDGGDYGLAVLSKEKPMSVSKILLPGRAHTRCLEILEFPGYFVACTHFPLKDHLCEIAADIVRLNLADRDKPVFLAGDFNSRPESKAVAILQKDFKILTDVTQNTYPADKPDRCIDYIMVDGKHADRVEVLSRKVIAAPDATDHCALVVKANVQTTSDVPAEAAARAECDVLVVGGGVAGVAAALQAGRAGASTVLVERGAQVGGNMTTGGVNFPGLFHACGRQIIDGCAYEVLTNAAVLSGNALPDFSARPDRHWKHQIRVDIPVYVAVAEEALVRAGVKVMYHTAPSGVKRGDGVWECVLSADGVSSRIAAKVLIDCTGDGTLSAMAGARRMRGPVRSPGSFLYSFANGRQLWERCDQAGLKKAFDAAMKNGELEPTDAVRGLRTVFEGAPGMSWNYVPDADASTAEKRAEANMRARASMLRLYRFLRKQPGMETLRIGTASAEVGVRETWRVEGDYVISHDDYTSGRKFEDAVCYAYYPVDLHSVEDGVKPKKLADGVVPTLPLRALCVKGLPNLLVAGRCVSADRLAASGLRVQGACMAMGQVAGQVAAMSAAIGCEARNVPLGDLRSALERSGAIVP